MTIVLSTRQNNSAYLEKYALLQCISWGLPMTKEKKCGWEYDDDGCHIDYLEVDEDQRAKAIEELEGK